jgi:hypothetical protein
MPHESDIQRGRHQQTLKTLQGWLSADAAPDPELAAAALLVHYVIEIIAERRGVQAVAALLETAVGIIGTRRRSMRPFRAPGDPMPEKPPIMPVFMGANNPPDRKPGRTPKSAPLVIGRWPMEGYCDEAPE